MRAQVSLMPTESKKLIAKAVARMEQVARAAREGVVVLHPSSSTYFIVEELTGRMPQTKVWVKGIIAPRGACTELENDRARAARAAVPHAHDEYSGSWVVREGVLSTGGTLKEIFDEMGPHDVYIKGVNALDPQGHVGVLIAARNGGGTIGRVLAARRRRGFNIICPVGLEKLILRPIEQVAREAKKSGYDYSMGLNCGLLPCPGTAVTEIVAIQILSGAEAVQIAAGGLGGAEGSVVLVIKGEKDQVTKAVGLVEQCKGAKLPPVHTPDCETCHHPYCDFPLKGKPWV